MADSLTLIVLVAAGGSPASTAAMLQAAHESLGPETRIEILETQREPTETDALIVEHRDSADAVAELIWKDRKRRQVSLRVHVAKPRKWLERTLAFDPSDVDVERSRTLGYAMAAILPEPFPHYLEHKTEPPPPPKPEPPPPAPPPVVVAPKTEPIAVEPLALPARSARVAIELLAVAQTGIGGDASAVGGELAADWFLTRRLSFRFGGGVEGGNVSALDVGTLTLFGSAGLAFHVLTPSILQPVGIAVRADLLMLEERFTHTQPTTHLQEEHTAVTPALDAVVDIGWMFVQGTEAVAGIGFEGAFRQSQLFDVNATSASNSATIPAYRVVGEAGLRASF